MVHEFGLEVFAVVLERAEFWYMQFHWYIQERKHTWVL
jgi:hypothetical protein